MRKTVLSCAVLALLTGSAWAQSSVTVFGVLDVAARSLSGADRVHSLVNEGRAGSRLGFRGVEDMGGGLKASFHIEHGLSPDSGSADGTFWQRRATVSLSGDFGEIRAGRHKTATRTLVDEFDPFATSGMPGLHRITARDRNRIDNQIGYYLPKMGDFYANVEVSAGEGSNSSGTARSTAGRLGYKTKALHLSAGYGQFGSSNKLKVTALGASYDFGGFALLAQHAAYKQGTTHKVSNLGATVKLGQGKLIGSWGKASGVAGSEADLLAIGYDYSLSKRTTLYTTYGKIDNKTGASFSLAGAAGRALPVAGGNSTGYDFGIRHNF